MTFINKEEYLNESSLKNAIKEIKNTIEEIQNICNMIEKSKNDFNKKNENVVKEINELKNIQKEYKKENIKRNNTIQKSLINTNQNKNNIDINKSLFKKNNPYLNNNDINHSTLLKAKDSKGKEELFKTINLFQEKKEDVDENYKYAKLLKKNRHEICYIYDDYDIHDIYYNIKAIGLSDNGSFTESSYSIPKNSEIELLFIDGKSKKYRKENNILYFDINLKNLEISKIHIKYKYFKNKDLSKKILEERKFNKKEYYGIPPYSTNGMGKYILINKGSYDIVKFDDIFFVRNEKNLNEVEYVWGGRVPSQGKQTLITFTKKEAKWLYNLNLKLTSFNTIRKLTINIPINFIEGNNGLINIENNSPQRNDVRFDEIKKEYVINYNNINSRKVEFNHKIKFQNKSNVEWFISLPDEEIEKLMPKEDIRDKSRLQNIAKKIIKDFDDKHKNNEFEFLDFMKIGLWVYENIVYDLSYAGKTKYTAIDIYNLKKGVCHHFTRLSNALLYSLGYKVLYATGFVCDNNKDFNESGCHAWSIIKLGNRWYPFDSTWGILTGKIPITHVFSDYNRDSFFSTTSVGDIEQDYKMIGKYIEE